MTITTTANKAVATGNSATTVWPFTFLIPEAGDLVVTLVDVASGNPTVLSPTLYTAAGLGVAGGGTVTYPLSGAPLTPLYYIVIERVLTETQETDLQNQGAVYPADIEAALDYLTMLVQQLQDGIDRSIVFSVADTIAPELPPASARAGLFLGFDSNGDPVALAGLTAGTTVSAAMIPVVTAPTTAAALTALGLPGSLLDLLIPAGTAWDYTLPAPAPTGFVLPASQACTALYPVYRAALVAAGSPYGTNGVDPLMPDYRSAVGVGKSDMGGVDNGLLTGGTVLGAFLGTQTKVLVAGNLPPHTHTSPTLTDPGHVHNILNIGAPVAAAGGGINVQQFGNNQSTQSSTTGITLSASTGNNASGVSTAFSIVQPSLVVNKILKVH
jgi:microcystin-dependent protein